MSLTQTLMALLLTVPSSGAEEPSEEAAATAIHEAIRTLDARIVVLQGLQARHAAGERVSIDAVRSANEVPSAATETLYLERRRIEDLKDAIRIAEAEKRRGVAPVESVEPVPPPVVRPTEPGTGPDREAPAPVAIPDDLSLRRRLAEVLYREGDIEGALKLYESVAEAVTDTWALLRRARCLERLGRATEARDAYEALVRDHADDPWAKAAAWSLEVIALERPAARVEGEWSVLAIEPRESRDGVTRLEASFEAFRRITTDLEEAYARLRERAERIDLQLAETNRRLAAILASLPVGVIETDGRGRITHVNAAATAILGIDAVEIRGTRLQALRNSAGEEIVTGDERSTIRELTGPVGTTLVRIEETLVKGPDGRTHGRVLTVEDLTEVETLRREVHRLDKLAALGEMSARLAHQIRNPLNGMQGFASMLARDLADRPPLRRQAKKVLEGARDLNRIVTNMLAFARPSPGGSAPCSLPRTVEAAVAWLEGLLPQPRVHAIRVRHDDPALTVRADRFHLEEAMRNLLLNAVEAMPDGGLIRVRTRAHDGSGEVTVGDTGPGVPAELRDRLFEPFVTGRERGTGLGLAIVRSVIEQAGGDLALRPSGRGARFLLRLRMQRDDEQGGPA